MNFLESIKYCWHKLTHIFCCCFPSCRKPKIIYGGGFKNNKKCKLLKNSSGTHRRLNYSHF